MNFAHEPCFQGISRRPKGDKAANAQGGGRAGSGPAIKKATFDTTKKKEVGVSDLTLISKVSNEAINDNLKKRFENAEIYVRCWTLKRSWRLSLISCAGLTSD